MVEAPGREDELLDLELPAERGSVAKARSAASKIAREVGVEELDVKIAVSEAVGNAVIHAYRDRAPGRSASAPVAPKADSSSRSPTTATGCGPISTARASASGSR